MECFLLEYFAKITSEKQFKGPNNWFEITEFEITNVFSLELIEKFKGPKKKFEIASIRDNER